MTKKTNKLFMAFAQGKETKDAPIFPKYIGVAPVFIKAVNPTKKELEEIYNITIENDPSYIGENTIKTQGQEKTVPNARIDFIVSTDAEKCDVSLLSKVTFFLNKEFTFNTDGTKVKVVNKYGEFAWLPVENVKAGTVPENQQWFDISGMRPSYMGEEELTLFLKAYMGIPNKTYKKDDKFVPIENLSDAEATLEGISNYFKGDFSELSSIIKMRPTNKVKCLFGIKNTDDGKQYQTVYTKMFYKNGVTSYTKLEEQIKKEKDSGYLSNVEYEVCPIKEYNVHSTDFNNTSDSSPIPEDSSSEPLIDSDWNNM